MFYMQLQKINNMIYFDLLIVTHIPDGLLNIFSLIIMGVPYIKDDKPLHTVPPDYTEPTDVYSKLLAIKTIGEFKFEDKLLKR